MMENNKSNKNYLTFIIDDKRFAFPILSLQCIVGNPNINLIKNSFEFVIGIFCMNDYNIPVLDLRTILNKPNITYPNKTCLLVVRVSFKGNEKLVGFIVDSLCNICHLQVSEIEKLPACKKNDFIEGISNQKDKMTLHINLGKIINDEKVIYFLNQFWGFEAQCIERNNRRNKNGI